MVQTWTGDENVLYSQTKTTGLLGAATNGNYYVLSAQDPTKSGLIFRAIPVDYTNPTVVPTTATADVNTAQKNAGKGLVGNNQAMVYGVVFLLVLLGASLMIYKKRKG